MGLPPRSLGGQPSKGPRRLISTRVSDLMASDIVTIASELGLSITDHLNLLLARQMGHEVPWWVAKKMVDDTNHELPLGETAHRRRRQVGPTRLVLVTPQEDAAGTGRRIGFRVPDDLADDIILKADASGLSIGDCTALLLARQLERPIPPWVQAKLNDMRADEQLALGA